MKTEKLLHAIGNIDDELILNAGKDKKIRKKNKWLDWGIKGILAACLCLVIGLVWPWGPSVSTTVVAYSYGTEEEITSTGAIMSTGTISDTGEMTGHPLMFFLSGDEIDTVRFSCKNQMIDFMDWTEKRDEYGNAKNFTVSYGENVNEYYFLVIDWVPTDTIWELTENEDSTIATLPEELREDLIVMEIRFANGETATKAIHISLQDDGTFFATFDDYKIRKEDKFIERPDSQAIPREVFLIVTFYDKEGEEVLPKSSWYNMAKVDHLLVQWTGKTPNTVRMFYTPSGTEMEEHIELLQTKAPQYGDCEIVLPMEDIDITDMLGHMEIELDYGDEKTTSMFNVVNDIYS